VRWLLGGAVLVGTGVALAGWTPGGPSAPPADGGPSAPPAADLLPAPAGPAVHGDDAPSPAPRDVRIPAIGVDSRLVPLGVDRSGALVPPDDTATAGWFSGGTAPGAVGPAVLAGHVDSYRGPGVFFRLRRLAPGDVVLVDRADGSTVSFTVTAVDSYPKDAFPTDRVYAPTPSPELRLITCGGTFDRSVRSYEDDVVVSARATA
jgi:hypothetical protein